MNDKLLVCTFSGGRTSAFMGMFLKEYCKYDEYDKVFIFANTGKEDDKTLDFIDKCDKEWNLNIVWLEPIINKEKGVGTGFKIVDYNTASRNGEPFKEMLEAYPMPSSFASNCTRELKEVPIHKYVKTLGYKNVVTAMGIRADEAHRISNFAKEKNIIYPLVNDIKIDSLFIRSWWDNQHFDLELKDYQGNCDLCFKKSIRKRLTLIKENPSVANWWLDMEKEFGNEVIPRFDLRSNKSIKELIQLSKEPFKTIHDKHDLSKKQKSLFDIDLDYETDCFCKAT
ncbi:MAG: phosphoadenosine phosphosulfate reductase family protein [Aureibaculum sp.]|nr:phosphoadenosine phosphosulfate reductase family protein [Aureibaculum sp.]